MDLVNLHLLLVDSLYGDKGGNEPFGNTNTGGLYGSGRFGYSIQNSESLAITSVRSNADWVDFNFNSDYSASAVAGDYQKVVVAAADLAFGDFEGVKGFQLFTGSTTAVVPTGSDGSVAGVQVSEFTTYDAVTEKVTFICSRYCYYN